MWHTTEFPTGSPATDPGVRLDIVASRAGFLSLEQPWGRLFDSFGRPHQVFQSFNWLWHWSNHFLDDRVSLAIVAGWDGDRLVMAWPLVRRRSPGGLVTLSWMGEPLSQYGDVLVEEGLRREALLHRGWALVRTMAADLISLRKVRADSVVGPLLAGEDALRIEPSEAPFVDMSSTRDFAAFEQRYSGKKRSTRRRLLRRLQDTADVGFETHVEGPQALKCVKLALAWKKAWLAETGHISPALRDQRFERFFEDVANAETRKTSIRVSVVTCNGHPAAVEASFACKDAVFGHMLAYDARFAKQGIGVVLAAHSIRTAVETGYATFDLLAPRDEYKMDWADGTVLVADHAIPLTRMGRLYAQLWLATRPAAKRLSKRLPARFRRLLSAPLRKPGRDRDGALKDKSQSGTGDVVLISLRELAAADPQSLAQFETHLRVRDWIYAYLMKTHPDLGRPGLVCPFTAHAARIDTVRIGVSAAESGDIDAIEELIKTCLRTFKTIPCPPKMKVFRTILIAFPRIEGPGLETLHKVQARVKPSTLRTGLMTAVFHEGNPAEGLWNPAFRPLQAPLPIIAIRHLVEADAPFVAGHPLLLPIYLMQFPIGGSRRLLAHVAKKLRRQ